MSMQRSTLLPVVAFALLVAALALFISTVAKGSIAYSAYSRDFSKMSQVEFKAASDHIDDLRARAHTLIWIVVPLDLVSLALAIRARRGGSNMVKRAMLMGSVFLTIALAVILLLRTINPGGSLFG